MPGEDVTEYATPDAPLHGLLLPVTALKADGGDCKVAVTFCAELFPQAFVANTEIVPEVEPQLTVIELVPCPPTMLAPDGTDQI